MLTSTKAPSPSSFLSLSALDLFKIGGSRVPRATDIQVRGLMQPPRVCRVNTGEMGGKYQLQAQEHFKREL